MSGPGEGLAEGYREVFRDRWLLVVDKASGTPTQGTRKDGRGLFESLREQEGELYLHHRLDQPASGLVLFARVKSVNAALTLGFRSHSFERRYAAVLYGVAPSKSTWSAKVEGKAARTMVRVEGTGAGLSAVRLSLDTGRKHQIRVHAAMAGTPVVGDRRYGAEAGRAWPRLALHATDLKITHPGTGEPLVLHSPVPPDLIALWSRAGGG